MELADLEIYLNGNVIQSKLIEVNREKKFWEKRLGQDTGSFINKLEIARNELFLFRLTGDVLALNRSDSFLVNASGRLGNTDPELLFSLSQSSITRHRFRLAAYLNEQAEKMKGDLYTVSLLQFDTWMELGRYGAAYKSLQSVNDRSSFDYLVRKAKWEDHNGRLDEAIPLMENALELVKTKSNSHYIWALSNLADMYGHAGKIKDAYKAYLQVLSRDPSNLYCLKGIAWIAFSHDGNYPMARRIIRFILSRAAMPELKLVLSEIAELENDVLTAGRWKNEFITDVTTQGYGDMYNKYLVELYSSEKGHQEKALKLAEKEVRERFTPGSCDLLAWAYYQMGDHKNALKIIDVYVAGRSFEPGILFHSAFIYAANGKKDDARKLLETCLESSFELGPITTREIREKLRELSN